MRIAIVNDSVMATEILRRIVVSQKSHDIIWTAKNGAEAIMHCNSEIPDLILMDLMMPVMDGVESTKRIMKSTPCAILVVTSTVTGHSSEVFSAMGAGALDAVATPVVGPQEQADSGNELLRKINVIGMLIGNKPSNKQKTVTQKKPAQKKELQNNNNLVAIGCSTGGPNAILNILLSFPTKINASVVIVQHMDKRFITGLVSWLNQQVSLHVALINEGDTLKKGTIFLSNSHQHLIMNSNKNLGYTDKHPNNYYHPSVDIFFNSIASNWHGKLIGVLLTGMGNDGAQGLLSIKNKGWPTISQDQNSSIVYGMPKAAVKLNASKEVLPLKEIGPRIISLIS